MAADNEDKVRQVIEAELSDLAGLWKGAATEEHNVFLKAISPTLAGASKLTRQLTSRLGGKLARIGRGVATVRYGLDRVPSVAKKVDLALKPPGHNSNDTFIWSDYDKSQVVEQALRLVTFAGLDRKNRIGTDVFRGEYLSAMGQLDSAQRDPEPWNVQVDLAVLDPAVGLAELESGGQLDSSNSIGQTRKLVQAGLALGDPNMPLHFSVAYANRGPGKPIQGGLPRYFTLAGDDGDGLLVGEAWWERVLPDGVSYDRFLEMFHEVAEDYQITP